jgi:hypothetical protein
VLKDPRVPPSAPAVPPAPAAPDPASGDSAPMGLGRRPVENPTSPSDSVVANDELVAEPDPVAADQAFHQQIEADLARLQNQIELTRRRNRFRDELPESTRLYDEASRRVTTFRNDLMVRLAETYAAPELAVQQLRDVARTSTTPSDGLDLAWVMGQAAAWGAHRPVRGFLGERLPSGEEITKVLSACVAAIRRYYDAERWAGELESRWRKPAEVSSELKRVEAQLLTRQDREKLEWNVRTGVSTLAETNPIRVAWSQRYPDALGAISGGKAPPHPQPPSLGR